MEETEFRARRRLFALGAGLALLLIHTARGQSPAMTHAVEGAHQGENAAADPSLSDLLDMADKDVTQLAQVRVAGATGAASLDMPVSSVSRQESTVGHSPSAVFVITNEMIRRSGAKEIPEVLRMVPGVNVAKINADNWAVSIRGFNGRFSNKILVRIDGRDVYTPIFAGTFWDVQDVLLEDVERIEVIRGPGATVWGANAVDGVINIITKNATETQGVYAEAGGGSFERGFTSARYGGQIGNDLSYRIYGKWFDRGPGFDPDGPSYDTSEQGRGGFRMDWNASPDDTITFLGDYYSGYSDDNSLFTQLTPPSSSLYRDNVCVTGDDAIVQWKRVLGDKSDWTAKVYYDQTQRQWLAQGQTGNLSTGFDLDTFDFDFQYRFPLGGRDEVICGLEYRLYDESFQNAPPVIAFSPTHSSVNLYSCFVQDEHTIVDDRLYLTLGAKFERNDFTGFEYQPSVRLLWTPQKSLSIWGAVSRAVRTPAIGEEYLAEALLPSVGFAPLPSPPYPPGTSLPVFPVLLGNSALQSEELIAYEAGIRGQPTEAFSWDLALFFNDYQRLEVPVAGQPLMGPGYVYIPTTLLNAEAGNTYGFELATTFKINDHWRLQSAYSLLFTNLNSPLATPSAGTDDGFSPRNQFYLQSSWDLGCRWELDSIWRYTDDLPAMGVPKYIVGDVRIAWHATRNMELSVVGRNLFNGNFYEFGNDAFLGLQASEVQPEVYGQLTWRF